MAELLEEDNEESFVEVSMEDGTLARVVYAFNSDIEGELNLCVGDIVQIDHAVDRHWYFGRQGQNVGNFPAGFVVEAEIPDVVGDKSCLFVASDNFKAVEPGDLGFNKNDIIIGLLQVDANWWKGEAHGRSGIFPITHVWQVDETKMKKKTPTTRVNIQARVKMDMKAQLEEEMDLVKGDLITITEIIDNDWMRGECKGKRGIFPSSFVVVITTDDFTKHQVHDPTKSLIQPPAQQIDRTLSYYDNVDFITPDQNSSLASSDFDCDSSDVTPYGMAQFSFVAQFPDELSFHAGEIVHLIRHIDEQWVEGEINGRTGFFPKSHVNIIVDCNPITNEAVSEINNLSNVEIVPGETEARVLYDYTAQTSEDLNLVEDELIYIYRRVNDEWYEAKDSQGKIGLCPANYLLLTHPGRVKSWKEQECNNNLYLSSKSDSSKEEITQAISLNSLSSSGSSCQRINEDRSSRTSFDFACVNVTSEATQRHRLPSTTRSSRSSSFLRTDFTKPRSVSDSTALEKSIAQNLANLDSSLSLPRNTRSTSFTNGEQRRFSPVRQQSFSFASAQPRGIFQRQMSGEVGRMSPELAKTRSNSGINGLPSTPPPRPLPPKFSGRTRTESVVPPRPPLPPPPMVDSDIDEQISSGPPEIPPPPLIPTTSCIRRESLEAELLPKVPVPTRAAPPPPPVSVSGSSPHVVTVEGSEVKLRSHISVNDGIRVPLRPAPPPPSTNRRIMEEEPTNAIDGIQRKILERENTLKQLQNTKLELDTHLIDRQDSHNVMHDDVRAYEETIDGLSSEIHSLKESAHKFSSENETGNTEQMSQNTINREKDVEKRKLVIKELLKTEQDYVKDLTLCLETFKKDSTQAKGLDFDALFGNLDEVVAIGRKLLESLEKTCAETNTSAVVIGPCFQKIAAEMKDVYGQYCSNHEEVIHLLEKYEENSEIQSYIMARIISLRELTSCFSLGSLLIKPVQRILKYPLLLNELIKCTADDHPDAVELQKAIQAMTDVATAINEYKRRRDLVVKYRKESDTSFAAMISKFNLHSLAKKSNRIGMRLSSTIGLTSVTKDETFDEEEQKFRTLAKTIHTFLKDVMEFCIVLEEWVNGQFHSAEHIAAVYADQSRLPEIDRYRTVQRELYTSIWNDFKSSIRDLVVQPLTELLKLFQGPTKLIEKRYDKLLDYDSSSLKVQKNKDFAKAKMLREEQCLMRNTYEALNTQLLEDLPKFFQLAISIFRDSARSFFACRKRFIGRLTKEILPLMELPAFQSLRGDILEDFYSEHVDSVVNLSTLTFLPKNFFPQKSDSIREKKTNKSSANKENTAPPQMNGDCEKVKTQYPPTSCYCAIKNHRPADPFEVPLTIGDVVGVIKQQDPMGGTQRWYIDNGAVKGFVPADCLVPLATQSQRSTDRKSVAYSPGSFLPGVKAGHGAPRSILVPESSELPPPSYSSVISAQNESFPAIPERDQSPVYYETPPEDDFENFDKYDIPFEEDSLTCVDSSLNWSESSKNSASPAGQAESSSNVGEVYYAAYDLHTEMSGTVNLTRGQQIFVLQKHDMEGNPEWWLIADADGQQGFAPANYLMERLN